MTNADTKDIKDYIVIQRCKPYAIWPRFATFASQWFDAEARFDGQMHSMKIQYVIQTYDTGDPMN